jgi:hypothetical protein
VDKAASKSLAREDCDEASLTEAAVSILERRLPARWAVQAQPSHPSSGEGWDIVVRTENGNSQSNLLVEAKRSFAPRDVTELTGGLFVRLRGRTGPVPILLVAPYISPRARELLVENDINYLDLTGNVRIVLDYPGLFIVTEGAQVDPAPVARGARGLRGAKVGAVVRALIDARPPYTGAQLARAARVNEGYVSRILDSLLDEGLITRPRSGPVVDADWQALLRQRAAALTLFRKVGTFRYVARNGAQQLLDAIANLEPEERPVITGSFAAVRLAPIAPPAQLVLYTMNRSELAGRLPLVEVETGADTVLIRPDNNVATSRPDDDGRLLYAAPSQVAIDCLSGSGRMPAEGEALIEWMAANENVWRRPSLAALENVTQQ